jgi:DNA repair photolyase
MNDPLPFQPKNGRGAVSAPAGRFERFETKAVDDGWEEGREEAPKLKTHLHLDTSRSVINYIDSPDVGFSRSINPYRGCEHGCIYCYARPSHSYLGFSAGLDFETEIFHKADAPEILRRELSARNYKPATIVIGSNTDCYQPVERELKLTRAIIAILAESQHPTGIITKSALVTRDVDLLAPMAAKQLVRVNISLTTLDPTLARAMEPRAAAPYKRLKTIETLAKAGIPVTVMVAPMIPGLNDAELERIMQSAYDAGARNAHYTLVRLPYELKTLFEEWLRAHYPDRLDKVLSHIRETRNGKLYDADYSQRRIGTGVLADLLGQRFELAKKRYGFSEGYYSLRKDLFRPPDHDGQQFALAFG